MHYEVMSIAIRPRPSVFLGTPTCRAEGDVVAHTEGKQRAILHHMLIWNAGTLSCTRGYPGHQSEFCFLGIVKAQQQTCDVDLPLPEGADQHCFWPGFTSKLTFRSATPVVRIQKTRSQTDVSCKRRRR